jgi:O-antigen/teichoic acid export membrane protein/L-amino acid N-acyltransferase YncA
MTVGTTIKKVTLMFTADGAARFAARVRTRLQSYDYYLYVSELEPCAPAAPQTNRDPQAVTVERGDLAALRAWRAGRRGVTVPFLRDATDEYSVFWWATVQGQVVGIFWLDTKHSFVTMEADEAMLTSGFVDPEYRGRGIFKALISAACRDAVALGYRRVYAVVEQPNVSSRRAFAASGLRAMGPLSYRWWQGNSVVGRSLLDRTWLTAGHAPGAHPSKPSAGRLIDPSPPPGVDDVPYRRLTEVVVGDVVLDRMRHNVKWSTIGLLVTLPFGPLTTFILARVGPEAIGTFSLLAIYLSLVSTVLYLGGGTVSVRFMNELAEGQRMPFFASYFVVTLASVPFVYAASAIPHVASWVVGREGDVEVFRLLLLLAPIPLLYFSTLAALRGLMEVAFANIIARSLTVSTAVYFGGLYWFDRAYFQHEYPMVILVSYFGFMIAATAVGIRKLVLSISLAQFRLRWFLPRGFWLFVGAVQLPSVLALLHQKLDQILVFRELGLAELGTFYLLLQMAQIPEVLVAVVLDSVFPAFMRLHSGLRLQDLTALYQKSVLAVIVIGVVPIYSLLAFAPWVLGLAGVRYTGALLPFVLLMVLASLDALGSLNYSLLSGAKDMTAWSAVQSLRLAVFVPSAMLLITRAGLKGVVMARGGAWLFAGALAYWLIRRRLRMEVRLPAQYWVHVALTCALGVTTYTLGEQGGFPLSASMWLLALAVFWVAIRNEIPGLRTLWITARRSG